VVQAVKQQLGSDMVWAVVKRPEHIEALHLLLPICSGRRPRSRRPAAKISSTLGGCLVAFGGQQ